MSLELAYDIWSELKTHLTPSDRVDAADSLINLLIDHDYRSNDILEVFRSDKEVKRVLDAYIKDHELIDDDDDDLDDYLDDLDDEY